MMACKFTNVEEVAEWARSTAHGMDGATDDEIVLKYTVNTFWQAPSP